MLNNLLPRIKSVATIEADNKRKQQTNAAWSYRAEPLSTSAYFLDVDIHRQPEKVITPHVSHYPFSEPNEERIRRDRLLDVPISSANRGEDSIVEIAPNVRLNRKEKKSTVVVQLASPPQVFYQWDMMNSLSHSMDLYVQRNMAIQHAVVPPFQECSR